MGLLQRANTRRSNDFSQFHRDFSVGHLICVYHSEGTETDFTWLKIFIRNVVALSFPTLIYMKTRKHKNSKKNKTSRAILQKRFLYNPNNPKKSFDVYIDKNPKDTIHIKYTTLDDVKNTISKLERLYKNKKYSHKRIWQVGMIMKVRLQVLKNKKPEQYKLSEKYFKFLGERTKMSESDRYTFVFSI